MTSGGVHVCRPCRRARHISKILSIPLVREIHHRTFSEGVKLGITKRVGRDDAVHAPGVMGEVVYHIAQLTIVGGAHKRDMRIVVVVVVGPVSAEVKKRDDDVVVVGVGPACLNREVEGGWDERRDLGRGLSGPHGRRRGGRKNTGVTDGLIGRRLLGDDLLGDDFLGDDLLGLILGVTIHKSRERVGLNIGLDSRGNLGYGLTVILGDNVLLLGVLLALELIAPGYSMTPLPTVAAHSGDESGAHGPAVGITRLTNIMASIFLLGLPRVLTDLAELTPARSSPLLCVAVSHDRRVGRIRRHLFEACSSLFF